MKQTERNRHEQFITDEWWMGVTVSSYWAKKLFEGCTNIARHQARYGMNCGYVDPVLKRVTLGLCFKCKHLHTGV